MPDKHQRQHTLERHRDRLWRLVMRIRAADTKLTSLRFGVFVATAAIAQAVFSLVDQNLIWPVFTTGALVFALMVRRHRQVRDLMARTLIMHDLVGEQLARMTLYWDGMPEALAISAENRHPLEVDLDLVGTNSLGRLLDSAETSGGSTRLRAWLNAGTADTDLIAKRQALVAELRDRRYLRNQLATNVRRITGGYGDWSADDLLEWLKKPDEANLLSWLWPLIALAISNIVLFLGSTFLGWPAFWQATIVVYAIAMVTVSRRTQQSFGEAMALRDALEQMQGVFGVLEGYPYHGAPRLRELCAPFVSEKNRPNNFLRRIVRIVSAIGITQGNMIFALAANIVFPFNVFLTVLLNREKAGLAEHLPTWLNVWFELEALASLATFAWLNPHYIFPTVDADAAMIQGQSLGHPLIDDEAKVANDYAANQSGELTIMTGSNMSGKSTFLRTLGVNAVLAYAGSVVDAEALSLRPMQLYTCIRVSDSVTDGFSYFYAEVRRLKGLLDVLSAARSTGSGQAEAALNTLPVFYLVDEIFRGTNNRERLIGSRSLLNAVAGKPGIGFISTHDLELVQLAEDNQHIRNFHFRERIEDGKMVFDYRLHDGPSPTTNALKIMRLAGLPIEESAD